MGEYLTQILAYQILIILRFCTFWLTFVHDDVIKWKHFPRYWPFVRGIHWSPVNSPHKGQWHGALMFYLICAWINGWVNNREAGDFRRHRAHSDVTVMWSKGFWWVYGWIVFYLLKSLSCSWHIIAAWGFKVSQIWVNIGSGNGMLSDDTKPLPEPLLTDHQCIIV